MQHVKGYAVRACNRSERENLLRFVVNFLSFMDLPDFWRARGQSRAIKYHKTLSAIKIESVPLFPYSEKMYMYV